MKTFRILLTIAIVTILNSCSSDDGADGKNGIDGIDGINGTNGTNGTNGVDGQTGATGTANVIYSAWITAPTAVAETIDGTSGVSTFINAPELSQEILSKGIILVYIDFGEGAFQLPYTKGYGSNETSTITAIASLKKIKLFKFRSSITVATLSSSIKWRYILIPGGVAAATAKAAKQDYSKMSYEEVCEHFNIQP